MNKRLLRLAFVTGLCSVAILANRAPARAVSEFCPATPEFQRIGDESSSLYAFSVDATGPRTVTGDIVVKADDKWYTFSFPAVPLTEIWQRWKTNEVEYSQNVFASAPFYVRFPAPVASVDAYVSDAKTNGEMAYHWDAQGQVQCSPPAGFSLNPLRKVRKPNDIPVLLNPRVDMKVTPDVRAAIITPTAVSAPGRLDCAHPFTNATVTSAVSPIFPTSARGSGGGVVLVTVLIDDQGKLADAWVKTPSGHDDLDEAALNAARETRYAAGTAFCRPAPGEYVFRAVFQEP